jgi:hypothetical protein
MKLNLEALHVDTFATSRRGAEVRGTIRGVPAPVPGRAIAADQPVGRTQFP